MPAALCEAHEKIRRLRADLRANYQIRTDDPFITNEVLYQLS